MSVRAAVGVGIDARDEEWQEADAATTAKVVMGID